MNSFYVVHAVKPVTMRSSDYISLYLIICPWDTATLLT